MRLPYGLQYVGYKTMRTTKTYSLDEVVNALRTLPDQSRQELAGEIMARVEEIKNSRLTDEPGLTDKQREIIRERMGRPRDHVSREDVHALLRKFNSAL